MISLCQPHSFMEIINLKFNFREQFIKHITYKNLYWRIGILEYFQFVMPEEQSYLLWLKCITYTFKYSDF